VIAYPLVIFGTLILLWALIGWVVNNVNIEQPDVRQAERGELKKVLRFAARLIPETPTLRTAKNLLNRNPSILWVLEKKGGVFGMEWRRLVGFFSLLPVTSDAARSLRKGDLEGIHFGPDHICSPGQFSPSLYIGALAATRGHARDQLLMYLRGRIEEEVAHGVRELFARPVTQDGLRLVKRHGFECVVSRDDDDGNDEHPMKCVFVKNYAAAPARETSKPEPAPNAAATAGAPASRRDRLRLIDRILREQAKEHAAARAERFERKRSPRADDETRRYEP
jgi:hypothetical protein